MSQFRFHNWQDDDSTFNLNQRLKGILPDGRYRGYEAKPFVAGMNLVLWHDVTGYKFIKQDLTSFAKVGCAVTKQGMVINETGEITIGILPNLTGSVRLDLIVMEHFYEDIVGGTSAIYYSIQGTTSLPPLSDPDKQVILGSISIPAGCTSLTDVGVLYTQEAVPFLAGDSTTFDNTLSAIYDTISNLDLDSLTDVTVTTATNGDIMVYNGSQWTNVGAKTHIQGLQLNMTEVFGQSGIVHTLDTENMQALIGGGTDEWGYIVTKNFARWQLGSSSVKRISRLTDLPIGTVIRMSFSSPSIAGFFMAGAGDYGVPIIDTHGRSGFIAIVSNIVYTFVRRNSVWMMLEEMPRANYNQTDPNALDYINNKPAAFVQTKANWLEASPASNAYIQNRPNVMEVVGRFDLLVGNVGGLTFGNLVTVVNNGGFPIQANATTAVAANTGGNTQQSSSITVRLNNPSSISYLAFFIIYSNGTTANDAMAYPTVKLVSLTSFNLGLREVATNITSDIRVECILIKSPIAL